MKTIKLPHILTIILSLAIIGIVYSTENNEVISTEELIDQYNRTERLEEKIDILMDKTVEEEIQEKLTEISLEIKGIKERVKTKITESIKKEIRSEEYAQKQRKILIKAISENNPVVCHTTSFPLGLHHIHIKPEKIKITTSSNNQEGNMLLKNGIVYIWENDAKDGFYSPEESPFSSIAKNISNTIISEGNPLSCSKKEIDDKVFQIPNTVNFIKKDSLTIY